MILFILHTVNLQRHVRSRNLAQNGGEPYLPPGFRFNPTDEELITCYLTRKVTDTGFVARNNASVDLRASGSAGYSRMNFSFMHSVVL